VARLRTTGAKLIFATTTPVPEGSAGRVHNAELAYNQAAVRVMKKAGVAIDDLHALVAPKLAELQLPRNVHFTPEGSRLLAQQVSESIRKVLPRPRQESSRSR
jgi:acyl-CoA thioesterase-1